MEEEMPKAKYLIQRSDRKAWISRYPVPEDVQPIIGKKHITTQIGTGPAAEIERQHCKNRVAFDKQFEDARLKLAIGGSLQTPRQRREYRNLKRSQNSVNARLAKLPMVDSTPRASTCSHVG